MSRTERYMRVLGAIALLPIVIGLCAIFWVAALAPDQDLGVPAHVIEMRP